MSHSHKERRHGRRGWEGWVRTPSFEDLYKLLYESEPAPEAPDVRQVRGELQPRDARPSA